MQRFAVLPLLFASACLGSINAGDDPPVEPTPEDPQPEPAADVRVTVRDGGTVIPDVKVVFQAPDDSVVTDAVTDATGTVSARMPNGGSVTVIRTYGPNVYGEPGPIDAVYTYVGVEPGDVLELVGPLYDYTPYNTKVTVGLSNGEFVGVMTPCGQGYGHAPTIDVQLKGCGGETDFYVINYSGSTDDDGVNSGPLFFTAHANLAKVIDFSTETFRGTLSTELAATPISDRAIALQKRLVLGGFTVFDTGLVGAPATAEVPELPDAEQVVTAHITDARGATQWISARDAFTSAPITIDVAGSVIPTTRQPTLTGDVLSWIEDGTGSADLSIATIRVGAVDRQFVRSIAAPYAGTTLRVPTLPAAHARYNVQSTDTPRLSHALVRVTGGYDGVRPRVFNHSLIDLAPVGGMSAASQPTVANTAD